jgi:hypothetical protein
MHGVPYADLLAQAAHIKLHVITYNEHKYAYHEVLPTVSLV